MIHELGGRRGSVIVYLVFLAGGICLAETLNKHRVGLALVAQISVWLALESAPM